MDFKEKIKNDMYKAMKDHNSNKVRALRSLLSKIQKAEIDSGKILNFQDCVNVLKTFVKQLKESISIYEKANRDDLIDRDKKELSILEYYLPKMMSDQEIKETVIVAIKKTGVKTINQIGEVMPVIMKLGGSAIDGKRANEILRELLV